MGVYAIIGLGCGDEGKGVVTEYLCSQDPDNTLVVRFSGGQQCGHKVIKDGVEHIFSNFGAGTLSGCPTYWSRICTFEPVGFWKEYTLLRDKGISPKIFINPECPVTTFYDVVMNRQSSEMIHGTTGTGFFRTKKRHFTDGFHFTVRGFLHGELSWLHEQLDEIRDYYGIAVATHSPLFMKARDNILGLLKSGVVTFATQIPDYQNYVFEGSQGLMLDENLGEWPHVTPSDVTPREVLGMVSKIDEVYLVSRVYQTRHGRGPMTNEGGVLDLINTEKETNVYNDYQGRFRVSSLDIDKLVYAKRAGIDAVLPDGSTKVNLVMTCADQMLQYLATRDGVAHVFSDVDAFVRFVGRELKVNGNLYVNTSPASTTIRRVSNGE